MSIKIASHIFRNRHGTFYFRLVVPKSLRWYTKQNELRLSLGTQDRRVAISTSLPLIENLPRHLLELKAMSEDDKATYGYEYFKRWVAKVKENIDLKNRIEELETRLLYAERDLQRSAPLSKVRQALERAHEKGQLLGKKEIVDSLVFPWPSDKTAHFSELISAYLKSLTVRATGGTKKPPNGKTMDEYAKSLNSFIEVMGDLNIGAIDREIAGEYFSILKKLPANLSRMNKYKHKTIKELIELGDPPQSEVNVSKKIERISTMFKWALEEKRKWGIDANPFTGYGQAESDTKSRRPFTEDELILLLTHQNFIERKFRSSYSFWLIPLALLTGARLGELCQLDIKDFVVVEDIPCIDINDIEAPEDIDEAVGKKKRVKNRNAKRLVPIHPELIRIGLLRHVERLRKKGETRFFPELNRERRDGAGHAASNWFQRHRKAAGLPEKQKTVFHSFRHFFITSILDTQVPPHMLAPIVGHEAELITGRVYWNTKDASKRKPTVDTLVLPETILNLLPVTTCI